VIADDDVRWTRPGLVRVAALLDAAELVRPQNVFSPLPWHARWDTGRSLINRALGGDYPGTYAVRRSTFTAMGGYAGDVLFENLELARTVRAAGGRELVAKSLLIQRRPPTTRHFLRQRTRQAYDDLAQPPRLVVEAAVLPTVAIALLTARRSPRAARRAVFVLGALLAGPVALAEIGRRVAGGRAAFPPSSSAWAPLWLAERAICIWIALGHRLRGGVPYAGGRLRVAAHSVRSLRRAAHRDGEQNPASPADPGTSEAQVSSARVRSG
jgi:hypothetical protein